MKDTDDFDFEISFASEVVEQPAIIQDQHCFGAGIDVMHIFSDSLAVVQGVHEY